MRLYYNIYFSLLLEPNLKLLYPIRHSNNKKGMRFVFQKIINKGNELSDVELKLGAIKETSKQKQKQKEKRDPTLALIWNRIKLRS